MHAKRTRDRKKQLLEVSEAMIGSMESESHALREYLVSLKLLSVEEAEKSEERASESKRELAALKVTFDFDCTFLAMAWCSNLTFDIIPTDCLDCAGVSKRVRSRWGR